MKLYERESQAASGRKNGNSLIITCLSPVKSSSTSGANRKETSECQTSFFHFGTLTANFNPRFAVRVKRDVTSFRGENFLRVCRTIDQSRFFILLQTETYLKERFVTRKKPVKPVQSTLFSVDR